MGHGEDVSIGRFFPSFVEANSGEFATFDFEAAHWGAQNHFPAATLDFGFATVVKIGQRDGGDSHAIAGAVGEKSLPENVNAEARVGAIEFFIESADEDNAPEPLDGASCLAATAEPFEHGDAAFFVEIGRLPPGLQNIEHGARDGKLVEQVQRCKSREGTGQMKWRRQKSGLHLTFAALRIEKEEAVEEFDFAGSADAAVEIFEIGAATERYVLAVVHVLAVGQHVGRCAATEEGTLFEQTYAPTRFSQRDAGCQSRQPAADHDHAFQGYSLPCGGRSAPWQRTSFFPLWEAAHARRRRQSPATRCVRARRCKYEPATTRRRGYPHR